jgi:hypothetical protein
MHEFVACGSRFSSFLENPAIAKCHDWVAPTGVSHSLRWHRHVHGFGGPSRMHLYWGWEGFATLMMILRMEL